MPRGPILALALLVGCIDPPFQVLEAPCESRQAWYPDEDQDGIGDDGGEVYVTCEQPAGAWTRTPPPTDTDAADTDLHDTDVGDTDVGDTDG